jgi:hypothetical protein
MRELIPIDEVNPEIWNVPLPEYLNESRIGLDYNRLHRFARLGGFASDISVNGYSGETSTYAPMIVGADAQGNAFAGAGKVKQARLGEADLEEEQRKFGFMHRRPPLRLRVNVEEMTQRIQHSRARLRDPAAWANKLNGAIGEGLRQATWDHLVRTKEYGELTMHINGSAWAAIGGGTPQHYINQNIVMGLVWGKLWGCMMEHRHLRDACWSLTPVVHPDRALLVSGLTRVRPIVKALR